MTVLCLKSHKRHDKKYINFQETLSLIKVRVLDAFTALVIHFEGIEFAEFMLS